MTDWEVTAEIKDQGFKFTVVEKVEAEHAIAAVEEMLESYGNTMVAIDEVYDVG